MSKRGEEAVARKHNGHNCAQAIACTYADKVDMNEEKLYALTQAFGGGLASMDGHCGCLSGAAVIVSLLNDDKRITSSKIKKVSNAFKKRNSTVICRELKGLGGGKMLRSCDDCVRDVAEFLEEVIEA